MIVVLVFGSRDLPERRPVWTVLNGIAAWRADPAKPILVIEGGCPTGADDHAARWAEGAPWPNIRHEQYPPDRRRTDNRRFYERNVRMARRLLELRRQGAQVAAWGFIGKPLGASPGSKMMAGLLGDAGLPYQLVRVVTASGDVAQEVGELDGPTSRAPFIGRIRRR
jgi:YspA, cpYpsA-related SLOG family